MTYEDEIDKEHLESTFDQVAQYCLMPCFVLDITPCIAPDICNVCLYTFRMYYAVVSFVTDQTNPMQTP